jgi:hypothetical protein
MAQAGRPYVKFRDDQETIDRADRLAALTGQDRSGVLRDLTRKAIADLEAELGLDPIAA